MTGLSALLVAGPATMADELRNGLTVPFELTAAENGERAAELARSGRFAVVMILPSSYGSTLAAFIRKLQPTLYIILFSEEKTAQSDFTPPENALLVWPPVYPALNALLQQLVYSSSLEKEVAEQAALIRKLTMALDQNPTGVIITDDQARIEYVNRRYCTLTEQKPSDAIGKDLRVLDGSREGAERWHALWETLFRGREWQEESSALRLSGDVWWKKTSISPVRDETTGRIHHIVAVIEDITRQKVYQQALEESEQALRDRNSLMEKDLENARIITQAIIPQQAPVVGGMKISFRYKPLEAIGGDYFSFTTLGEGGLGVFLGDLTGHGVSAALFLALVKAYSDRMCRKFGTEPSVYMQNLNTKLFDSMSDHYLTALYLYLKPDADGAAVSLAKGGHPAPLLFRAGSAQPEVMDEKGLILGVLPSADFPPRHFRMNHGDRLLIYTDGITEATNLKGQQFEQAGLVKAFLAGNSLDLEKAMDSVLHHVERHCSQSAAQDDQLIIAIEIN